MPPPAAASPAHPRLLTLIVATTPSLGIGRAGTLPWPALKGDMAHFKRSTSGAPGGPPPAVLMGRRTWASLPARARPLPGRVNVVVTSNAAGVVGAGARAAAGLGEALAGLDAGGDAVGPAFVIGGASMYAAALQLGACRRVLLTRVRGEFECDVFFPLDLDGEEARAAGWRRGDVVKAGWVEGPTVRSEGGVEYEFCLYER